MNDRSKLSTLILWACCVVVLMGNHQANAATSQREYTIVMVLPRDEWDMELAFKDYLKKQKLLARFVEIPFSGGPQDAVQLVQAVRAVKPDLIYSAGASATLALVGTYDSSAKEHYIRDIPVIFVGVLDPVGAKLVAPSASYTGRNITGVSSIPPLLSQLSAMRAYRPVTRLGFIVNPNGKNTVVLRRELQELAKAQGLEIIEAALPLDGAGQVDAQAIPEVVRRIAQQKVDFLYVPPTRFLSVTHRDLLTQAAEDAKLPTFCTLDIAVLQSKCLLGLFANSAGVGRFAGYKAIQILRERIAVETIPVEALQKFSLAININVAKNLDLYPPVLLLNTAEVVGVKK